MSSLTKPGSTEAKIEFLRGRTVFRIQIALFVLVFGTNLYFHQGGDWNQNTRLDLTRAIVEGHTLRIDKYAKNTFDRTTFEGHVYCDKAPGLSFLAVPPYFLFYHAGLLLGGSPDGDLFNIITIYLTRAFTVYLIAALGAVVLFRLTYCMSGDLAAAVLTTIGYAFGTLALPYGMVFFGHIVGAVLCLTAFYLVFAMRHGYENRRRWLTAAVVGVLLGLAVISEYPTAMLAGFIGLYAISTLRWQTITAAVCGALPLIGLLAYNHACFGKLLTTGYAGYAVQAGTPFDQMGTGFYGVAALPSPRVLFYITISPYRGLFVFCPFLILGLIGLGYMLKQRRFLAEWIVFVLSVLAFLAFNASYAYWHGGASVGPRHLIPMIPYLAAAAVFTVSRHRGVSIFVIAVSACLLLMIVFGSHGSSDWRSNPIWHWVMDSVRGKTSGCKDGVFTTNVSISRDWNAFNLGELIRLPVTGPRRADSVISRHCQDTEVLLGLFLFVMLRWLRRLVKGAHGKQSEETA